jgi:hypothetical protein
MDNTDGLKVCIDEMNRNLKMQYEAIDSLKATARSVLSAASLITGLLAVLQLARPTIQADYVSLYNVGIGFTLFLYALLIIACVAAISGLTMKAPLNADWNELQRFFASKTGLDLVNLHLASLLKAVNANEPIIKRQRLLVLSACILLPVIVAILLALSIIPR